MRGFLFKFYDLVATSVGFILLIDIVVEWLHCPISLDRIAHTTIPEPTGFHRSQPIRATGCQEIKLHEMHEIKNEEERKIHLVSLE